MHRVIDSPESGLRLELAVGDSAELRLPHPSGTGYRWSAARVPAGAVVRQPEAVVQPVEDEPALPGQARTSVIELVGGEPGEGELRLVLSRPWERVEPMTVISIQVVVR